MQPPKDAHLKILEQERKTLAAQAEKHSQALKTLYLDKASGILTGEQFAALNQSFLGEQARLEQRLAGIDTELSGYEESQRQADRMERARELLKLETVPRELAAALVEQIEIGERDPVTGEQQVRVTWRF